MSMTIDKWQELKQKESYGMYMVLRDEIIELKARIWEIENRLGIKHPKKRK